MSLLLLLRNATSQARRARLRVGAALLTTLGVAAVRVNPLAIGALPAGSVGAGAVRAGASVTPAAAPVATLAVEAD